MNGRHIAPWAVYTDGGAIDTVFLLMQRDLRQGPIPTGSGIDMLISRGRRAGMIWVSPGTPDRQRATRSEHGARSGWPAPRPPHGKHVAPAGFSERARAVLSHDQGMPAVLSGLSGAR